MLLVKKMIYLGKDMWLDIDKIIIIKDNPIREDLIFGDKIVDNEIVLNCNQIPGTLLTSSAVFDVIKKGRVIRMFSSEHPYPNMKVSTSKTAKTHNRYYSVKRKSFDKEHIGEIVSLMGDIGDMNTEKAKLELLYNINYKKLKIPLHEDMFSDVREEFDVEAYTIDPDNCYDIDDALHYKENDDTIEIGIHIADVSSMIPVGSDLDKELLKRAESVYLDYKQLDMMPENYVTECSLFKGKKSRVFSVFVTLLKDGKENNKIIRVDFRRGYLKVKDNLTYDNCLNKINKLYELGKSFYKKEDYDSHKMVEVFMIMANTLVAKKIKDTGIYKPVFRKFSLNRTDLTDLIKDSDKIKKIQIFNSDKAFYSFDGYHDELGEYSHFTSPIRRYCDIIIHRMLWNSLKESDIPVTSVDINYAIEHLNFRKIQISKGQRESRRLVESFNRENEGIDLEQTSGYVVRINKDSVTVYVPEHSLTVNCSVPEDLIEKYLRLGQDVKLNILASFYAPKFREKLYGEITEPDIKSFFLSQ